MGARIPPVIYIDVNIVIQISSQALNKVSCSEEVLAGAREGSQVAGEGRRVGDGHGWGRSSACGVLKVKNGGEEMA